MRAVLAALAFLIGLVPALADEAAPPANPAAPADAAAAADPVRTGRVLLEANCSGCHAIGLADPSPNPEAPPFRAVVQLYPPEDLAEAFGEGISTGHPEMPEFELTPDQINGLIAYLNTLLPPS